MTKNSSRAAKISGNGGMRQFQNMEDLGYSSFGLEL